MDRSAIALAVLLSALAGGVIAAPVDSARTARPSQATSTPPPDLIVDGRVVELSGSHTYGRVVIRNRGRLEIAPHSGNPNTGILEIHADWIELDGTSRIMGTGAGYRGVQRSSGEGPGGGEGGPQTLDGAGGGAYGGDGGDGVLDGQPVSGAAGGREYGTNCGTDLEPGSAGGAPGTADSPGDDGAGGDGGAAIRLVAPTVLISGTIELDGEAGTVVLNDAAGGGAGGGLLVDAVRLELSGRVQASGGDGAEADDGGGGGGGGRIKLFHQTGTVSRRLLRVDGGRGDGNGYRNDGEQGSICVEVRVPTPTITPTEGPTATSTPTATATGTATPTASNTPEESRTPTASPTRAPEPLYLPLALREVCPPSDRRPVALVIVLDASSSMLGSTSAGRTKLDAALEAVRVPILMLQPPQPGLAPDTIGIVTFNEGAQVVAPLTADKGKLLSALSDVRVAQGSMLDRGVDTGTTTLGTAHPSAGRRMVILSDGLPAPTTADDARAAAARARASGATVDTIALGADADQALLAEMSSGSGHYFYTPDAEQLVELFSDLAYVPPPCNGVPMWPDENLGKVAPGSWPHHLGRGERMGASDSGLASSAHGAVLSARDGGTARLTAFDRRDQIMAPGVDFARAGDLDGDGDPDFVGVSPDADDIAWWANDGDGDVFTFHQISRSSRDVRVVSPGDADGDGDLDLFTLSGSGGRVGLWENDGYGNFTESGFTQQIVGAGHIEAADLDRNGRWDLLVVGYDPAYIDWYQNRDDGELTLERKPRIASAAQTGTIVRLDAGDIDGDGLLDFATADQTDGRINWWRHVAGLGGEPGFERATPTGMRDEAARDIAIGDFTRDGLADLVVVRSMPYRVWLWLGTPDGFVRQAGSLADSPGDKPWNSIDAADVNGDGALDFLTSELGGELCWYQNDATLPTPANPTASPSSTSATVTPATASPTATIGNPTPSVSPSATPTVDSPAPTSRTPSPTPTGPTVTPTRAASQAPPDPSVVYLPFTARGR